MSARDFIHDTLIPWLDAEIEAPSPGSKQYLAGFEDALRAMAHFLDVHRHDWDS